jgi:hypothetical protein
MSKTHLLTEDQSISNKAWMLFNANLNKGFNWQDAKTETELDAEKLKIEFDANFVPYDDPIKSDIAYEKSMNQFEKLVQTIKAIWI